MVRSTAFGPSDHFLELNSLAPVGITKDGPMPQMSLPGLAAASLKMHPQTVRRVAKQEIIPRQARPALVLPRGRRCAFLRTLFAAPRHVPQRAMTEDSLWPGALVPAAPPLDSSLVGLA